MEQSTFGSGLVGWTSDKGINTLMHPSFSSRRLDLLPHLMGLLSQAKVVCIRKWWEADSEVVDVGSAERVEASQTSQIDMLV